MNRIYLSASFVRQAELRGYRDQLIEIGFQVVSRWLDEDIADNGMTLTTTVSDSGHLAADDFADLGQADTFVTFTELASSHWKRGGRHVELGIAIASLPDTSIHVIGRPENVFHCLPNIHRHAGWVEFLEWVDENVMEAGR